MSEKGFWWRRGLLGAPVAALLTGYMVVLVGRGRAGWGVLAPAFLLGFVAWPITFWLLDRIFGRHHPPS